MIGSRIAVLRKESKMTQEALAQKLGLTNQAVSKWEANQCCPDIQLLPRLADIFGVSIDSLFGREKLILPWEDDEKLRAVIYIGHKIIKGQECSEAKGIEFVYEGPALNIESSFSVNCDIVEGDVTAGEDVYCDIIEGDAAAGRDINCDTVDGDVTAGRNVNCGDVDGDVTAGGNVECGDVGGSVEADLYVECGNIGR